MHGAGFFKRKQKKRSSNFFEDSNKNEDSHQQESIPETDSDLPELEGGLKVQKSNKWMT